MSVIEKDDGWYVIEAGHIIAGPFLTNVAAWARRSPRRPAPALPAPGYWPVPATRETKSGDLVFRWPVIAGI
jgi:hypothetical protein